MPSSPMFTSLRHRNVRLFFVGLMVSATGSWTQVTAMALLVYQLTGNATDVGVTLFCQFLPILLLGMWAGVVADRRDKRRMTLLTQSLLGVQALVLGGLYFLDWVNLPALYGLSLALGIITAFDIPARRGFVIELVEPQEITNAMSLTSAVMTGSRIVGPSLAAVLSGPLGAGWLFVANGLSFAAILWPLLAIDRSALHPAPNASRGGTPVRDALRFVFRDRRLRVIFVVFTVVATFAFNFNVSLLKIADARFGRETLFGILLASNGLGSMIGSLLTAARPRVTTRWFFGNGLLLGVSGFCLAWAPNAWVAVLMGVPFGIGGAAFVGAQTAIAQQDSPADMRGRLLALGAVAFVGSTPIGAPITGWIADRISAEWSLGYGATVAIVSAIIGYWLLQRDRRVDRSAIAADGAVGAGPAP